MQLFDRKTSRTITYGIGARWLFCLFVLSFCGETLAQGLPLSQNEITSNFGRSVELLADAPNSMTAAEALNSPLLKSYDENLVNLGPQDDPAWIRFRVVNTTDSWGAWVLNTLRSNVEVLEIYRVTDDSDPVLLFDNGDDAQRRDSLKRFFNLVAPLYLAPQEEATVLLRFKAAVAGWLPMRIIPATLLTRFTFSQFSLFILTTAGTGILILYNMMLFVATRDRSYFLYTGAISALLLACLHLQGMTTAWWFYASPEWGRAFGASAANVAAILLLTFARRFLNLSGRPWPDNWFRVAVPAALVHLFLIQLGTGFGFSWLELAITSSWGVVTLIFVSLPIQAFTAHRGWRLEETLLGIAWTILAWQFVTLMLSTAGVIAAGYMDWYLLGPACFTEASLVAISLAVRVRRLQSEKERADARAKSAMEEMTERAQMILAASHDARNLVGGALALNARVSEAEDLPKARSESRRVDQLLENLSQTMNLMVSSHRQVGPTTIPMIEEINVDELFETLVLTYRARALESGKSISWRTDGAVIACDRGMLVRVLSNLMLNALKYSKGERILLVCRHLEDSVVLRIYDQGPGLDEQELSRILAREKPVRLSPQQEGAGVGLSICRDLVEAHGASLEARSRAGGGSMFGVRIPSPDLSANDLDIEFVAEPELWERYSKVVQGSRLVSQPNPANENSVVVRSENVDVTGGPGLNVVACFDRSQESRDRWAKVADAILCFPVTLSTLAYAITVARHKQRV